MLAQIRRDLLKWQGGEAKLWSYSASLKRLEIRIVKPDVRGNLHVRCLDTSLIEAPTSWNSCSIRVEPIESEGGGFILTDESAEVLIRAGVVATEENVKPVFLGG